MNLRKKVTEKINKKLKKLKCRDFDEEFDSRAGVFTIINDLYDVDITIDDIRAAYESVSADGAEKKSVVGIDGESIYKSLKSIANYAFSLYFDEKFTKERFLTLLQKQAKSFYNNIDVKEKDFSEWTIEIDFLFWVNSTLSILSEEDDG